MYSFLFILFGGGGGGLGGDLGISNRGEEAPGRNGWREQYFLRFPSTFSNGTIVFISFVDADDNFKDSNMIGLSDECRSPDTQPADLAQQPRHDC